MQNRKSLQQIENTTDEIVDDCEQPIEQQQQQQQQLLKQEPSQQLSPQVYDSLEPSNQQLTFVDVPKLVGQAFKEFRTSQDNFLRGCKWSPDGSCILACSNDNRLNLFNLPQEFLNDDSSQPNSGSLKENNELVQICVD